jgi:hypothetical protein
MVHIGDQSFYENVIERLGSCGTIIYEGVPGFRSRLLTQAYRITARNRSLKLVAQRDAIDLNRIGVRTIHADVTEEPTSDLWRTVPWYQQLGLLVLAPMYGCWTYFTASRQSLARGQSKDSLSNAYALGNSDSDDAVRSLILTKRDERIVSNIDKYLEASSDSGELTAILFGAGHMPALAAHLSEKHGYSSKQAEWVSVIGAEA